MNYKYFLAGALPVLAMGIIGVSMVSAHGGMGFGIGLNADPAEVAERQQTMFTERAAVLGVSVDEVKNAWAEGKTMRELAEEKGISDEALRTKMQEQRAAQMKTQLQTLVSQGVITQAQMDTRLEVMATRQASDVQGRGGGHRGMHGGFGF